MPGHDHCCVPLCTNRRDRCPDLSFHQFPREDKLRRQWLAAIRRDEGENFRVNANTVVCSGHFVPSDYVPQDCTFMLESSEPQPKRRRPFRKLQAGAVPSVFAFKAKPVVRPSPDDRRKAAEVRSQQAKLLQSLPKFGPPTLTETLAAGVSAKERRIDELTNIVASLKAENALLRSQVLRFENVVKDSRQLLFFTGLDQELWSALWYFLKPEGGGVLSNRCSSDSSRRNSVGAGRKDGLSLQDQLFMTLMRLRLGRLEQDLMYQFGVSLSTVSRIVIKWINFLYLRLSFLAIWPDWEGVWRTMPSTFRTSYPNTFAIIDATELKCEVPSSLSLQSQHYSAYKSSTTMKCLVAIAPNGTFIFVSELVAGSISDRALFEQSGLLPLLDRVPRGKSIMADRGFEVQDLLVKAGLILNAPPFKGSKKSLSEDEVRTTQQIARVRIHVERAIGQVKSRFHVFDDIIPMVLAGSINQMWSVCCMLCNFLGPLVADQVDSDEDEEFD